MAGIAAALSTPLLCAGQNQEDTSSLVNALKANNNAEVIAIADRILASHPEYCRVLTIRAIALSRENQESNARKSLDRALQSCPRFLPALEAAAQIDYAQHAPTAAALLQRILTLRPDDQTANAMLGTVGFERNDCSIAVKHFEKSQAVIRNNEEAQREYGLCLFAEGDKPKAEDIFFQLAAENPDERNLLRLALIQWKSGQLDESIKTIRPLLSQGNTSGHAFTLAAQVAEDKGDTASSVTWFQTAILKEPRDEDNYLLLATVCFTHGSYQVGIDVVNAGLQQVPDSGKLYLAKGVLEVQLSQADAALRDFEKAHSLDSRLSLVQDAIGMLHAQQADSTAALMIYRREASEHPRDPLIQFLYAEALSEQEGDRRDESWPQAIAAARRAIELEPEYQAARDLLCRILLQNHQFGEVVKEAELALKYDPNDQSALYEEMQAERRLGNKAEAGAMASRLEILKTQERTAEARGLLEDTNAAQN